MEYILALAVALLFFTLALTIDCMSRIRKTEEERIAVLSSLGSLTGRVDTLTEELTALRANVDFVNGELKAKAERDTVAEKEIAMFNEGLNNILNYSVDKAKGGGVKK